MPILTSVKFVKSDSVLFSPLASEVFCSEAGSPARSQGRSPNSSSWYSNLQSGLGVGVCPFVSLTVSPVLAQSLLPGSLSGRNSCSVGLRCHGGWSGGRWGLPRRHLTGRLPRGRRESGWIGQWTLTGQGQLCPSLAAPLTGLPAAPAVPSGGRQWPRHKGCLVGAWGQALENEEGCQGLASAFQAEESHAQGKVSGNVGHGAQTSVGQKPLWKRAEPSHDRSRGPRLLRHATARH